MCFFVVVVVVVLLGDVGVMGMQGNGKYGGISQRWQGRGRGKTMT